MHTFFAKGPPSCPFLRPPTSVVFKVDIPFLPLLSRLSRVLSSPYPLFVEIFMLEMFRACFRCSARNLLEDPFTVGGIDSYLLLRTPRMMKSIELQLIPVTDQHSGLLPRADLRLQFPRARISTS